MAGCFFRTLSTFLCVADDGPDPSTYSGKIIECSWNSEEDVWVCMRVRVDKGSPNEFNTYRKVHCTSLLFGSSP